MPNKIQASLDGWQGKTNLSYFRTIKKALRFHVIRRNKGVVPCIDVYKDFSGPLLSCSSSPLISQATPLPHWPQDAADIAAEPSVTFGVLENGVRYAIMPNGQACKTGWTCTWWSSPVRSRNARDQRGLAHFMEHIAFCGSTHFKPGELIHHFQRLGMSFGADANAHTGFDETVYGRAPARRTGTEPARRAAYPA